MSAIMAVPIAAVQVPEEAFALGAVIVLAVVLPFTVAWSRKLWRSADPVREQLPSGVDNRLDRLEQAVEAIAFEVERIGEGQRFLLKTLDREALPAARPVTAREE